MVCCVVWLCGVFCVVCVCVVCSVLAVCLVCWPVKISLRVSGVVGEVMVGVVGLEGGPDHWG